MATDCSATCQQGYMQPRKALHRQCIEVRRLCDIKSLPTKTVDHSSTILHEPEVSTADFNGDTQGRIVDTFSYCLDGYLRLLVN